MQLSYGIGTASNEMILNSLTNFQEIKAKKLAFIAIIGSFSWGAIGSVVLFWFSDSIIVQFTTNQEIISIFMTACPIFSLILIFDSVQTTELGIMWSIGYKKNSFYTLILTMFMISAPCSYWMAFENEMGFKGAFLGLALGVILLAAYFTIYIWTWTDWERLMKTMSKVRTKKNRDSMVVI
jgi:Na+-driven multidrug efflux pump